MRAIVPSEYLLSLLALIPTIISAVAIIADVMLSLSSLLTFSHISRASNLFYSPNWKAALFALIFSEHIFFLRTSLLRVDLKLTYSVLPTIL